MYPNVTGKEHIMTAKFVDHVIAANVPSFLPLLTGLLAADACDRQLFRATQLMQQSQQELGAKCTPNGCISVISPEGHETWAAGRWQTSPAHALMCAEQPAGTPHFDALRMRLQREARERVQSRRDSAATRLQGKQPQSAGHPDAYHQWCVRARQLDAVAMGGDAEQRATAGCSVSCAAAQPRQAFMPPQEAAAAASLPDPVTSRGWPTHAGAEVGVQDKAGTAADAPTCSALAGCHAALRSMSL